MIRRLSEGGLIPPHFELQVLTARSYSHLKTTVDVTTILSYVVQLAVLLYLTGGLTNPL